MRRRTARVPGEPNPEAIAEIVAWLAKVAARARRMAAAKSVYLIVSPLGMSARGWLEAQLEGRGLPIQTRTSLTNWPRISTAVQVRRIDAMHLRRAVLYEAAWSGLFPTATAEAWGFKPALHARLVAAKPTLRAGVKTMSVMIGPRPSDNGVLHGFHLADALDAEGEASKLEAALNCRVHRPGRATRAVDATTSEVRARQYRSEDDKDR